MSQGRTGLEAVVLSGGLWAPGMPSGESSKGSSSHPEQGFALFSVELLIPWESNPCLLPFQGLDAHREGFHPLHQEEQISSKKSHP